ncbi:MAG: hypothetical protein ABEJ84_05680 [Halodesulfurarchaeum sp.]
MRVRPAVAILVGALLLLPVAGLLTPVAAEIGGAQPDLRAGSVGDLGTTGPTETQPGATMAATTGENTLRRTVIFSLRPGEPGVITAKMRFEIPDQVVELKTAIPSNATVEGTPGFEPAGNGNYSWDGSTVRPSVTLAYSVNRTGAYHLSSESGGRNRSIEPATGAETGYTFVDTGNWAIATVFPPSVWWSAYRDSPRVSFERETAVKGSGVAGASMVFLGEHTSLTRTVDGTPIRLVVPAAATLEPSETAVLNSIEAAAPFLPESDGGPSVLIAAPTSVNWGPYGLAEGSDAWVRADESIGVAGNVWLHEFVHLRQDFRTDRDARWINEGMAEYYAAYLTLEQGRIDFADFRDHLDRATSPRYDETVLTRPETWDSLGNYVKGALVYGTIDRQIRMDTRGSYTARYLFERLNERGKPIDHAFLRATLERLVDAETARELNDYMSTRETPEMWSRAEHRSAFGSDPPNIVTTIGPTFAVTGPYRNRTVGTIPTLVPNERLSIPITVTNEGGEAGTYDLVLTVDGEPVAEGSGTLEGGQSETLTLRHTFERKGTFDLSIGSQTWTVTVRAPATPIVSNLQVSRVDGESGQTFSIAVTISNPNYWPASGTITTSIAERGIQTWHLNLDANATIERSIRVQIPDPGHYRVRAGGMTASVTVVDSQATPTDGQPTPTEPSPGTGTLTGETTDTITPGFTPIISLLALLVAGGRFVR